MTKYLAEQSKLHATVYMDFILLLMMVFLDKLFELFILAPALSITKIQTVRVYYFKFISQKTMHSEERMVLWIDEHPSTHGINPN